MIKNQIIEFELNNIHKFAFELHVPLSQAYKWIGTNGFFIGEPKKWRVFQADYLFEALTTLIDELTKCFSLSDAIRASIFEQGVGHYENMRKFHMPDGTMTAELSKHFEQAHPNPSINSNSLTLWGIGDGPDNAQTWLYSHEGKVYLEIARIYDWDECDEQDYENFKQFMSTFQCFRYELSPEKAVHFFQTSVQALSAILEQQEATRYESLLKDFRLQLGL